MIKKKKSPDSYWEFEGLTSDWNNLALFFYISMLLLQASLYTGFLGYTGFFLGLVGQIVCFIYAVTGFLGNMVDDSGLSLSLFLVALGDALWFFLWLPSYSNAFSDSVR